MKIFPMLFLQKCKTGKSLPQKMHSYKKNKFSKCMLSFLKGNENGKNTDRLEAFIKEMMLKLKLKDEIKGKILAFLKKSKREKDEKLMLELAEFLCVLLKFSSSHEEKESASKEFELEGKKFCLKDRFFTGPFVGKDTILTKQDLRKDMRIFPSTPDKGLKKAVKLDKVMLGPEEIGLKGFQIKKFSDREKNRILKNKKVTHKTYGKDEVKLLDTDKRIELKDFVLKTSGQKGKGNNKFISGGFKSHSLNHEQRDEMRLLSSFKQTKELEMRKFVYEVSYKKDVQEHIEEGVFLKEHGFKKEESGEKGLIYLKKGMEFLEEGGGFHKSELVHIHGKGYFLKDVRVNESFENEVLRESVLTQLKNGIVQGLRQNIHRLTIKLHPPELGRLVIVVKLHTKEVSANIRAENQKVADFIKTNVGSIEDALGKLGFKVHRVEVKSMISFQQQSVGHGGKEGFNQKEFVQDERKKTFKLEPDNVSELAQILLKEKREEKNSLIYEGLYVVI